MPNSNKGFASLSPEERIRISRLGGNSVPKEKRSFFRNRKLASDAGRKGGMAVSDNNRSFFKDRELAAAAGRKGGLASNEKNIERLTGTKA